MKATEIKKMQDALNDKDISKASKRAIANRLRELIRNAK
jgi:hypothetical protein